MRVREFTIHSVETVSEVSQKSIVKNVTHVKTKKRDQKVKRIFQKGEHLNNSR